MKRSVSPALNPPAPTSVAIDSPFCTAIERAVSWCAAATVSAIACAASRVSVGVHVAWAALPAVSTTASPLTGSITGRADASSSGTWKATTIEASALEAVPVTGDDSSRVTVPPGIVVGGVATDVPAPLSSTPSTLLHPPPGAAPSDTAPTEAGVPVIGVNCIAGDRIDDRSMPDTV